MSGSTPPAEDRPTEMVIEVVPAIEFKGGQYSTMTLREPRVTEVQQSEALIGAVPSIVSLRRYQMSLVSKVSDWPLGALDLLPIRILDRAGRFVLGFTEPGPPTGNPSSDT